MKYVYLLMIVNLKSRRMTYCWKRVRCYQTNWMREWSPLSFAHLSVFWSTSVFDTFTSFKQIPALELEASLSGFESTSDNFFVNRLPWLLEQTSGGIIKGSLMLRILLPFCFKFSLGFFISRVSFEISFGQFLLFLWCIFIYDWVWDWFFWTRSIIFTATSFLHFLEDWREPYYVQEGWVGRFYVIKLFLLLNDGILSSELEPNQTDLFMTW